MSETLCDLCAELVADVFGPVVASVARFLLASGPSRLSAIVVRSQYERREVQLALQVLLQHGLVQADTLQCDGKPQRAQYTAAADSMLQLLRYSRYLLLVKTKLGSEHEMVLDELLRRGQEHTFAIVLRAARRINETQSGGGTTVQPSSISDRFQQLVTEQYLCRSQLTAVSKEDEGAAVKSLFSLPPPLDLSHLSRLLKQPSPGDDCLAGDDSAVWWRVNFSRLECEFRDQLVLASVSRTCGGDAAAVDVMCHLLTAAGACSPSWCQTTNPVSVAELKQRLVRLPQGAVHPDAISALPQYLRLFSEGDRPYCDQFGDAGGGQYVLNMRRIFTNFTWSVADDVVQERFGSRAGRIFRLIRLKKYVEQDKIHQWAMIPPKEAKLLTYQLHRASFINTYDLRKPGQQAVPGRVSFLFTVSYMDVLHQLLQYCFRALLNLTLVRRAQTERTSRLRDKQLRVESIVATLSEQGADAEQLEEVQLSLTESERAQLRRVETTGDQLSNAEVQLDQTLFILRTALKYCTAA